MASKSSRYMLNKNKYLLTPEVIQLEHILDTYLPKEKRDCVLLYLALNTGARAQEILNLKAQDIDAYEKTIFIHGIKGSNDRELPLHPWLFKELERLMALRKGDHLFPISYSRLRQIWEHYRPIPKKFHSLRHTFAIRLYKKTKDIRLLQVALGHRNITNTMIYADYLFSKQELKRLIL